MSAVHSAKTTEKNLEAENLEVEHLEVESSEIERAETQRHDILLSQNLQNEDHSRHHQVFSQNTGQNKSHNPHRNTNYLLHRQKTGFVTNCANFNATRLNQLHAQPKNMSHDYQSYPPHTVSERVFMTTLLKHTVIALAIIVPLAMYSAFASTEGGETQVQPVTSVDAVNLSEYTGTWYEIARFPMYFQRKCASDVTATYSLNIKAGVKGGLDASASELTNADVESVGVLNACKKSNGEMMQANGLATPANQTGSELKVTFLPKWLRWLPCGKADYCVLDLADDYSHALVGTPDRKYLWILSRTPNMTQSAYDSLTETARMQGFDTTQLKITKHSNQASTLVND